MKRFYAVLNLIVAVMVIAWNYLANTGKINGKTVGGLSDDLDNLFTPAGYAFAIWGLIFLGLVINGIYQVKIAYSHEEEDDALLTGPWLIIANLANGAWIWFWLNEYTGSSVVVMLILLGALIKITIDLRLENYEVSLQTKALAFWPHTLYIGWISVALIANVAAYLSKIGWADSVNETTYTILMIIMASLLNLWVLYSRRMRLFCLVGIWSLIAIAMANKGINISVHIVALLAALILLLLTTFHFFMRKRLPTR